MVAQAVPPPQEFESLDDLVARAQQGDKQAFAEILRRYERPVYNLLLSLARNQEDAEDLAQEVWLRVLRSLPQLRSTDRFVPWLYRTTRHAHLDHVKTRRRRPYAVPVDDEHELPAAESLGPEHRVLSLDDRRKVWEAIGSLPERYRSALFLREYEGLSYADIGSSLGISRGAAEVLLFRARESLRRHYAKADESRHTCVVTPLRLSSLLDDEIPLAVRDEIGQHVVHCRACSERLEVMRSGRTLYRGLGLVAAPHTAAGAALLAKLGLLFGGSAATTAAVGTSAGVGTAAVGAGVTAGSTGAATGLAGVAAKVAIAVMSFGAVTGVSVHEDIISLPAPQAHVIQAPVSAVAVPMPGRVIESASLADAIASREDKGDDAAGQRWVLGAPVASAFGAETGQYAVPSASDAQPSPPRREGGDAIAAPAPAVEMPQVREIAIPVAAPASIAPNVAGPQRSPSPQETRPTTWQQVVRVEGSDRYAAASSEGGVHLQMLMTETKSLLDPATLSDAALSEDVWQRIAGAWAQGHPKEWQEFQAWAAARAQRVDSLASAGPRTATERIEKPASLDAASSAAATPGVAAPPQLAGGPAAPESPEAWLAFRAWVQSQAGPDTLPVKTSAPKEADATPTASAPPTEAAASQPASPVAGQQAIAVQESSGTALVSGVILQLVMTSW